MLFISDDLIILMSLSGKQNRVARLRLFQRKFNCLPSVGLDKYSFVLSYEGEVK